MTITFVTDMYELDRPPTFKGVGSCAIISQSVNDAARRDCWNRLIDEYLVVWGCDPSQLSEDGLVPPSNEVINLASKLVLLLRNQGAAPADRIMAMGDGGVALEWLSKDRTESSLLLINADLRLEHQLFQGTKLVHREFL